VEEHVHEELIVVKANAVCNPWTVMIHLKNTSIALGAVMASIRLGFVTPLADSYSTKFLLLN